MRGDVLHVLVGPAFESQTHAALKRVHDLDLMLHRFLDRLLDDEDAIAQAANECLAVVFQRCVLHFDRSALDAKRNVDHVAFGAQPFEERTSFLAARAAAEHAQLSFAESLHCKSARVG